MTKDFASTETANAMRLTLKRLVDQVASLPARPHDREFQRAFSEAYDMIYGEDEFTTRFMAQEKKA